MITRPLASMSAPSCTMRLAVFVLTAVFASACGSQPAEDLADTGVADALITDLPGAPTECQSNSDCPSDWWCTGGAGCDEPWTCVEENPCSAAAPFVACTCRGVYDYVSAGCPNERFAYADWELPEYLIGETCNGQERTERGDLVLNASGFDAFEGQLAHGVMVDGTFDAVSPYGAVQVREGAFAMTWYQHHDPALADYSAVVWIDAEPTDGECTDDDSVWAMVFGGPDAEGDAVVTLSAESEVAATCL